MFFFRFNVVLGDKESTLQPTRQAKGSRVASPAIKSHTYFCTAPLSVSPRFHTPLGVSLWAFTFLTRCEGIAWDIVRVEAADCRPYRIAYTYKTGSPLEVRLR